MHQTLFFCLFLGQTAIVPIQTPATAPGESPRIQPIPREIKLKNPVKPALQEAPPANFVPPNSGDKPILAPPTQTNQSGNSSVPPSFSPPDRFDPRGTGSTGQNGSQSIPNRKTTPKGAPSSTGPANAPGSSNAPRMSLGDIPPTQPSKFSSVDPVGVKPLRSAPSGQASRINDVEGNNTANSPTTFNATQESGNSSFQSPGTQSNQLKSNLKSGSTGSQFGQSSGFASPRAPVSPPASQGKFNLSPDFGKPKNASPTVQPKTNSGSPGFSNSTRPPAAGLDNATPPGTGRPKQPSSSRTLSQFGNSTSPSEPTISGSNIPAQPTRPKEVVDPSFNTQLHQVSQQILKSLRRPAENRLSLANTVQAATTSSHRKKIVKQYWTCFVNNADRQFAEQELKTLSGLPRPSTQLGMLQLRASTSAAQARLAEAETALRNSTVQLHRLAPVFDTKKPISFADLPWIGKYQTNAVQFAKTGVFDQKIEKVDKALPTIRDLVLYRGAAVYDNQLALNESISAMRNNRAQIDLVLRLHQETRDQRIAFLKNIREYNHAIADYAISVFPNASQPGVVAKMLVDTELTLPSSTSPTLDPGLRQASETQPPIR